MPLFTEMQCTRVVYSAGNPSDPVLTGIFFVLSLHGVQGEDGAAVYGELSGAELEQALALVDVADVLEDQLSQDIFSLDDGDAQAAAAAPCSAPDSLLVKCPHRCIDDSTMADAMCPTAGEHPGTCSQCTCVRSLDEQEAGFVTADAAALDSADDFSAEELDLVMADIAALDSENGFLAVERDAVTADSAALDSEDDFSAMELDLIMADVAALDAEDDFSAVELDDEAYRSLILSEEEQASTPEHAHAP